MGKMKHKKTAAANRPNPVGIPSVQELLQHEEEIQSLNGNGCSNGASIFIPTILEQLQSHTVEERDSGLNSLAAVCSNRVLFDELLKHDIIKIVGPLLIDKSIIVRHSAAGALRNMSTVDPEVCDAMVSQGIMTFLVQLFKQHFGGDWEPHKPGSKNDDDTTNNAVALERIDSATDTFIQAVNLLWNLCESSEAAIKNFNRNNLGSIVCKCLNVEKYGVSVSIAAAQCLNGVTEDNSLTTNSTEIEVLLQKVLTHEPPITDAYNDWIYLQMLCANILLNLQKGEILKLSSSNICLLLNILSRTLDTNIISQLKKFSSEIPIDGIGSIGQEQMEVDDERKQQQHHNEDLDPKKLQALEESAVHISNLLNAQMLACETLSNILFIDDEEVDVTDDEDDNSSGDYIIEGMEESSVVGGASNECEMDTTSPCGVISEVFEGVISHQMVEKVLKAINLPPVNVLQIISESPFGTTIPETLLQLRSRALLCYQNLVVGLDTKDLGGFEKMKATWDFLIQLVMEISANSRPDDRLDQLEATTSAMRALIQKWVDENCSDLIGTLVEADFKGFCDIYNNIEIEKIQANVIKIIGCLGTLIVRKKEKMDGADTLLLQVGEFLLNVVINTTDRSHLWRIAEALDTIFDVFSEDDFNHILNQLKMIEKLKLFLPQFKKVIKLERRTLGENKAVIDTARLNLSRFIDYKTKHGCN